MTPAPIMYDRERRELRRVYSALMAVLDGKDRFELYSVRYSYGQSVKRFEGDYTAALVEALGRDPTTDELIMLVDNGYFNFGAYCVRNGTHFVWRIYTD